MNNNDIEKFLIKIAKEVGKETIENSSVETLALVCACVRDKTLSHINNANALISALKKMRELDEDIANELISDFVDNLEKTLEKKIDKEEETEEDRQVKKKIENEIEKINDYLHRVGIDAEVDIHEVTLDD